MMNRVLPQWVQLVQNERDTGSKISLFDCSGNILMEGGVGCVLLHNSNSVVECACLKTRVYTKSQYMVL